MYKYLVWLLAFNSSMLFSQEWEMSVSLPDEAPARHHPVNFTLDGYGYLGTGSAPDNSHLDDFWRFDPQTQTWESLPPFPGGKRSFSYGVTYGNKAYVGFGRNEDGPLNDLWEYDPSTETWTELDTCLCVGRTHPALVAANGHIYVGLGGGGGNKNDWWAYNIESGSWEQRTDFPSFKRHHPFYFEIDDYAYVGMGHGDDGIYNDLYRYDHPTDSWITLTNLPGEGRVAGTQFSFNGKGYVLSGDGEDHDHMEEGEFWEYDPIFDSWTELNPHLGNGSRWAPGNFIIGDTLYFMAGQEADVNTKDMMTYVFETGISSSQDSDIQPLGVFPNPAQNFLELEGIDKVAQLSIYSADGRLVQDRTISNPRIDVSDLSPGLYLLRLISGDQVFQSEFYKE